MNLKNLSFLSLLKDSWRLYTHHLGEIWKVYGFLVLSSLFLYYLNALNAGINSNSGRVSFLVAIIATVIFSLLVTIAYYLQLQNVIEKRHETVQRVLFRATPLFWPYLATTIVHAVLLIVATFLLIIPGIAFFFLWIFFRESVVFRKKSMMKALDYSFSLVRYRWWRVTKYFIGFLLVLLPFYVLVYISSTINPWVEMSAYLLFLFFAAWISLAQVMFFFHLEQTRSVGVKRKKRKKVLSTKRRPQRKKAVMRKSKKSIKRTIKKRTRK